MKTRINLLFFSSTIISLAILLCTLMFLARMHEDTRKWAATEQEQAIRTFWQLLHAKGDDFRVEGNRMKVGAYELNGNFELPDRVQEIFGGTATIFMGDTRISTNVLNGDGSRAVGTRLQGPAYDAIFRENRPYRGETDILGITYFTAYDPIFDANGRTIGVLYVGSKKSEFLRGYNRLKIEAFAGSALLAILLITFARKMLRRRTQEETRLQEVARILSETTGDNCFSSLVENLSRLLGAELAFIGELGGDLQDTIRVIAAYGQGKPVAPFSYRLKGTPCAEVMTEGLRFYPDGVARRYPDNRLLDEMSAEGFLGMPLKLADGTVIGILVILDSKPLVASHDTEPIFRLFAVRAAAELDHIRSDMAHQEMAERIRLITDSVPVGIAYVDLNRRYLFANRRYAELFEVPDKDGLVGRDVGAVVGEEFFASRMKNINHALDGNDVLFTHTMSRRDGSDLVLQTNYIPHRESDGAIIGYFIQHYDITAQKQLEADLHRQLKFLQTLIDTIPSPIFYKNRQGRYTGCNLAFCHYLGKDRDGLVGKTAYDLASRELADRYHEMDEALFTNPGVQTYDASVIYADGSRHEVTFNKATFSSSDGQVEGLVGVILDLTERKQAEKWLSGEKAVLEMIVQNAPLSEILEVLCKNFEAQFPGALCSILEVDETASCLRHLAAPTMPREYIKAIDGTRIGEGIGSCGTAAARGLQVISMDIATDPLWDKYKKLPLSFGLQASWSQPVMSNEKTVMGTFAVYYTQPRQPTPDELVMVEGAAHLSSIAMERKRGAETLRQIQLRQQAVLNNIPDLVWLKDRESRFITVNKSFADACGETPAGVTNKSDLDIWPLDLAEKYRVDDEAVIRSGEQIRVEELMEHADGTRKWIETIKMPFYDEQGLIIGTTGIARDIEKRKRTEEALLESEERFHQIFSQNGDAILLIRMDNFDLVDANPAALALFGYDSDMMITLKPYQLIASEDFETMISAIPGNLTEVFQLDKAHGVRMDGASIMIAVRCKILRLREEYVIHCSIRDITEKSHLEEEVRGAQAKLIHANKMTSIGMLASSVAHEINNPNNCISVNAAMLADVWQDAAPMLEAIYQDHGDFMLRGIPFSKMREFAPRLLVGITEGSRRITAIVQNMKDYVRENKGGCHGSIDINQLLQNATSILWHHIHINTDSFRTEPGEGLPLARGNGQQIEQVLINLITNALQALPDKKSGVCVTTCLESPEIMAIKVIDEGVGMDEGTLRRLAEPFFTTRTGEGGTGLGLYISSSIVKEHGGSLEFQSEPGKGTTATVRLPLASPLRRSR